VTCPITGSTSLFLFLEDIMPAIDFRQLRSEVTMAEILDLLGFVVVERRGAQVRGQCPFHEPSPHGKHRSFSANLRKHLFRCFKCGAAGNQLDLWAGTSKKSVHAAALELCARLHKEVPRLENRRPS
jgi:DNA primase